MRKLDSNLSIYWSLEFANQHERLIRYRPDITIREARSVRFEVVSQRLASKIIITIECHSAITLTTKTHPSETCSRILQTCITIACAKFTTASAFPRTLFGLISKFISGSLTLTMA